MGNPTKEIRAKLNELGIVWAAIAETATEYAQEGIVYRAYEFCGGLQVAIITPVAPEQAIAATVGTGTCHMNVRDNLYETEGMGEVWLECDECHWQMQLEPTTPRFKHCPNCGKRIVMEVSE